MLKSKMIQHSRKGLAVLVTFCMVMASLAGAVPVHAASGCSHGGAGAFSEGSGTQIDPYIISTPAQLDHMREHLSSSFELGADIEFSSSDYSQSGAFYNGGEYFRPVGTLAEPFTGTLDGANHRIKNLQINCRTSELKATNTDGSLGGRMYVGLFGMSNGADVKNVAFDAPVIKATIPSSDSTLYSWQHGMGVGVVSGGTDSASTFSNIGVNRAVVEATATAYTPGIGYFAAGGIIGFGNYSRPVNCAVTDAIINVKALPLTTGFVRAAGINAGDGGTNVGVDNSVFAGTITLTGGNPEQANQQILGAGMTAVNCFYDSTVLTDAAAISGANGLSTGELQNGTLPSGLSASIWSAAPGLYPYLSSLGTADGCGHTGDGAFAEGKGTQSSPFIITTAAQLDHMREHLSSSFELGADIVFQDTDYEQGGAFYNDGQLFLPVGSYNHPFTGTLEGSNYRIKNLKINFRTTEIKVEDKGRIYAGLFGMSNGATVRNVAFDEPVIKASIPAGDSSKYKVEHGMGIGVVSGGTDVTSTYSGIAVNGGSIEGDATAYTVGKGYFAAGGILGFGNLSRPQNCSAANMSIILKGPSLATGFVRTAGINGGDGAGVTGADTSVFSGTIMMAGGDSTQANQQILGIGKTAADCYYDNTKLANAVAVEGAKGIGTAELQNGTLPSGLDARIWGAKAGGYPYLIELADESAAGCGHSGTGAFTEGSGSLRNPYIIKTAAQLDHMREHLSSNFKLGADIVFRDSDYAQSGAFYNGGESFRPVGSLAAPFTGSLDGDNHRIENLQINCRTSELKVTNTDGSLGARMYVGLFGMSNGADVKNIAFGSPVIKATIPASDSTLYSWQHGMGVGVVSGGTDMASTFSNIAVNKGIVEGDATAYTPGIGYFAAGGILGFGNYSRPENCAVTDTDLSVKALTLTTGFVRAAGINAGDGGTNVGVDTSVFAGTITLSGGNPEQANQQMLGAGKTAANCYYDSTKLKNAAAVTGANAVSTANLQKSTLPLGLSSSIWTAEEGAYPYLTALGNKEVPEITTDAAISAAPSGRAGILGMMPGAGGYGAVNTIVMTQRTVKDGNKLIYTYNGTQYELFYSSLLDAYLGYVPAAVTQQDVTNNVSAAKGAVESIRYGIVGTDRANRDNIGFKDLYYFDKTALLENTIPQNDIEWALAMDVNGDFELDLSDLMSMIGNYVFGTEFSKAAN